MNVQRRRDAKRRGISSVLAMMFLGLFTVLSVAMAVMSTSSVEVAGLQHEGRIAYAAAESGLHFVGHQFARVADLPATDRPDIGDDELPGLWATLCAHFAALNGTANLQGQTVTTAPTQIALPPIRVPVEAGQAYSDFRVTITKQPDARYMTVAAVGRYGQATRTVQMTYRLTKDTTILKYAVASRSAIVMASGSLIEGDLFSTWGTYMCGGQFVPSYVLEEDCTVEGSLATHETRQDWEGQGLDQFLDGTYEGIAYGVPPFDSGWSADQFDTTRYRNPETEIRPGVQVGELVDLSTIEPDRTLKNERFPPKVDGNPREHFDRPLYKNRHFDNIYIPVGYNPQFENCTFDRIVYVDCDDNVYRSTSNWREFNPELPPDKQDFSNTLPVKPYWKMGNFWHNSNSWPDTHSNNVIFENCTFNGPVISNVPKDYFWSKNALYFKGQTLFYNDYMPEATILAPNFNVNIGALSTNDSNSVLKGLVVGGLVDVRGQSEIEGTILSTFFPDADLGVERAYYRTNIGYYDDKEASVPEDAQGTVHIKPCPDGSLPLGVVTRIVIRPQYGTYQE